MSLKNVLGHNNAIKILKNEIKTNSVKHSYIFHGIKGVGKKFTAIQFAKVLFCQNRQKLDCCDKCNSCTKIDKQTYPDVTIVDFNFQANFLEEKIEQQKVIKIDVIREVQRLASLTSYSGIQKVFIIDSAETMQRHAANSLLKILEEPPKNCIFILISTGLGMLPKTILSRCELIKFLPLNIQQLKSIAADKLDVIYENSFGSIENISYLEKIIANFEINNLKNISYQQIQTLSDELSKDKELTKFFMFYLIEKMIKKMVYDKSESLFDYLEQFIKYYHLVEYNLDLKLFLDTILTNARILWNKN